MFIIFGTKTRKIKENSGHFVCPQCEILRPYWVHLMQTWFTLFFVPVFPVGEKKNKHVECQHCKSSYYPRILNDNTFNVTGEMANSKTEVKT